MRPLLPALVLLLVTHLAYGEKREDSGFWEDIVDPGRRRLELAIARGKSLLAQVEGISGPLRARVVEDALAAFREATVASPHRAEGWFWTGTTLYRMDRMAEAIDAYQKARQLDAGMRSYQVAFELGIAYSKTGEFAKAVQEYDRADQVLTPAAGQLARSERATVHGNAAEALMALGRLDEAIQRYGEAVRYGPGSVLLRYGLAVAYDRDEQISKARQQMLEALAQDPQMHELTRDGVFFIPEGDIHYYFALGHECAGNLEQAKRHWQQFLERLPRNTWAARAQTHLSALGAGQPSPRKRGRLAPVPGPQQRGLDGTASDERDVRARLRSLTAVFTACYQKELRAQAGLTGRLRLAVTVGVTGRAERVHVLGSTLQRPALHQCLVQAVKRTHFGVRASARKVSVEFPVEFKP